MKQLLQTLTEIFAPSGYEQAVREVIMNEIRPLVDELRVDALGNLIARKGTRAENGKRVMVAAHMDEIGLVATHIDQHGFVRFTTVGAASPRFLLGGRVRFANGARGVIGAERAGKANELSPVEKLFIDVGAASPQDCPVKVGDAAAFDYPFHEMGRRLAAKALDNRAGAAVAVETLRRLGRGPNEVYVVFTVQEEVGARGASVSAYGIDPEIGLSLDTTPAGDTPNVIRREIALGKGPAIKIKDAHMLADPRVVDWMTRAAEGADIPTQREVLTTGTSDARAIQLSRAGVPSGGLCLPCRYVHSPSEMVDLDDLEHAVQLLVALLENPIIIE
ncbi:MAG: M42 family metallopeptidase [Chloroflexota bacterium]